MGRIKTQLIKRLTLQLFEEYKKEFTEDFDKNKPLVEKFLDTPGKKIRNMIAGYITRLVKKKDIKLGV